jgi:hypothetical protein
MISSFWLGSALRNNGGILLETDSSVSSHKLFLKKLGQVTMKLQKNGRM